MYSVWRVVHDSCILEYIYGGKWIYKEPPFVGVYPRAEYLHNNGVHRHTLRHTDMNSTVQKRLIYCYFLIFNISHLSSFIILAFFNLTDHVELDKPIQEIILKLGDKDAPNLTE